MKITLFRTPKGDALYVKGHLVGWLWCSWDNLRITNWQIRGPNREDHAPGNRTLYTSKEAALTSFRVSLKNISFTPPNPNKPFKKILRRRKRL